MAPTEEWRQVNEVVFVHNPLVGLWNPIYATCFFLFIIVLTENHKFRDPSSEISSVSSVYLQLSARLVGTIDWIPKLQTKRSPDQKKILTTRQLSHSPTPKPKVVEVKAKGEGKKFNWRQYMLSFQRYRRTAEDISLSLSLSPTHNPYKSLNRICLAAFFIYGPRDATTSLKPDVCFCLCFFFWQANCCLRILFIPSRSQNWAYPVPLLTDCLTSVQPNTFGLIFITVLPSPSLSKIELN